MRRSLKKLTGITGSAAETRTLELMSSVRLAERYVSSQPGQLSGGLKQRLAIARSFAGNPKLVVCDEPTSALDVSVQAAILNLLVELQAREQVSYMFISHDLGVVRYVSDRIAVLYLGRLMELGLSETVYEGPHHPYTEALLSAVPIPDPRVGRRRMRLEGEVPSPINPPSGCHFHPRCPIAKPECARDKPVLKPSSEGHWVACHLRG
jgi:peptide/nickel transport system ATP-binding protein